MSPPDKALLDRLRERALAGPCHPRASREAIADAERELGFRLPRLLRAVYHHVGNGGFGPGDGLIGVGGTEPYTSGRDCVVDLYERQVRSGEWPEKLLPICDYGCASFACVHCSRRSARVLRFDADAYLAAPQASPWKALRPESPSLAEWFEAWLEG